MVNNCLTIDYKVLYHANCNVLQFQIHCQAPRYQQSPDISYLLQKCKKGKPSEISLPFLKNDITTIL